MSQSVWIGTSNRGFGQQAQEEIRRLFDGQAKFEWLIPNEVFICKLDVDLKEAVRKLTEQEPIFLRHIQPVDQSADWNGNFADIAGRIRDLLSGGHQVTGLKVTVQARKTEDAGGDISPSFVKRELDAMLEREFAAVSAVKDADTVLSLFFTASTVYYGCSRPEENLSDWPGGAVRFRKEEGQVSRAKFKLLEAELAFGLDFSRYRSALDIGAAPGGWTSLLLERGLQVTAVDPAKLDAGLLRNPRLTYLSKNAGDVTFAADSFDLLVCDMSWGHRQMAKLVKGLLYALQPGGTAVITIKLMHKKAFQTLREALQDLAPELELQKAKQLFHNREELTLFMIKK